MDKIRVFVYDKEHDRTFVKEFEHSEYGVFYKYAKNPRLKYSKKLTIVDIKGLTREEYDDFYR